MVAREQGDMDQVKKLNEHGAIVLSSDAEANHQDELARLFREAPIPESERLANLGLFMTSKNLARILFFYEIYQKIVNLHGVAMEFGVRWGQTLSVLSSLRGIFEPFNRHRKIVGFDTFCGFKGVDPRDGEKGGCGEGSFSVPEGYVNTLERILHIQEQLNPMEHIRRFELVEGDAAETIPDYFRRHPETIVSLAIFDFDIYRPTRVALECIQPHLCKGSVLVFDELCDDYFPGETLALKETLGIPSQRIRRHPMASRLSYIVME